MEPVLHHTDEESEMHVLMPTLDPSSFDTSPAPCLPPSRGRLKLFLGATHGVGKTFAMLRAAHSAKAEGIDVVAGLLETHSLAETDALASGLERIPPKRTPYQGYIVEELDIDTVLARQPRLVLVDALEYANVPGSRHPKRYQDIEELLAHGIDVYTTLNIQHVESLNDVVARIANMPIRETVPDKVLALADEIELIDTTPKALQHRLKAGKVYVPEQLKRAESHLFSQGNLNALRELALRYTAERVDRQLLSYMRARGIDEAWPTRDRLMVCIDNSPSALELVRSCSRLAERQKVSWLVVYVNNALQISNKSDYILQAMQLAEELGGESCIISGDNIIKEILTLVRLRHVTRVMIGKPRTKWYRLFSPSVAHHLFQKSDTFELLIIPTEDRVVLERNIEDRPAQKTSWVTEYGIATLVTLVAAIAAFGLHTVLPVSNLSLVFLSAVLYVALRSGLWPSIYTTILSLVFYNFLFMEPQFTFSVMHDEHLLTLVFFLLVAMVTSRLAARVQSQVAIVKRNSELTASLYEFSKKIASARDLHSVLRAIVYHVGTTFGDKILVMLPENGQLRVVAGYSNLDETSRTAAEWAWRNAEPAGCFCPTMPESPWIFIPMKTESNHIGILGIYLADASYRFYADQKHMLFTLAQQAAVVVERAQLAEQIDSNKLHVETEKLRTTLLSSLSRNFRISADAISGAVGQLQQHDSTMRPGERKDVLASLFAAAEQLGRFTKNLQAIVQYGDGTLELNKAKIHLRPIIASALALLKHQLAKQVVIVDIPEGLRGFYADPALLEQAIVNLLEYAGKSPNGSTITLTAYTDAEAMVIECQDEGKTLKPEERKHMFAMLACASDEQDMGELGLAVCRGIIEAHGGTITAEEGRNGKGVRIVIRLS